MEKRSDITVVPDSREVSERYNHSLRCSAAVLRTARSLTPAAHEINLAISPMSSAKECQASRPFAMKARPAGPLRAVPPGSSEVLEDRVHCPRRRVQNARRATCSSQHLGSASQRRTPGYPGELVETASGGRDVVMGMLADD